MTEALQEGENRVIVSLRDKRYPQFFRAGHKFVAGEPKTIVVNDQQLEQLKAEPKLEVTIQEQWTAPPQEAEKGGDSSSTESNDSVSEADATQETQAALFNAFASLDADNAEHFTKGGKPELNALKALFGIELSAKERDEAWIAYLVEEQGGED